MTLEMGEELRMDTRVGGGPTFYRDVRVENAFAIEGHGGELYRDEIERLAEAAGLGVTDRPSRVVVAQHEASGTLLKVCEGWDSFDQWLEQSEWDSVDVDAKDCNVREYQEGDQ